MSLWKLCESCCGSGNTGDTEMREVNPSGQPEYNSRPPRTPWEPQPADIFNLARTLAKDDSVTITGRISPSATQYTINLLWDRGGTLGVAFQLKVLFDTKEVEVRTDEGSGLSPSKTIDDAFSNVTRHLNEENSFSITFAVQSENAIELAADRSYLTEYSTSILPEIRFLQVLGDVEKVLSLKFEFGS